MSTTADFEVDGFSYQSRSVAFAEWANLFTLCLAPLVAHVLGGVPTTVYLWHKSPRWHDRLWQFNPTSILWRYFVITDRRIRARAWNVGDMAASNAYFWTAQGWDGSMAMMEKSRPFALRLPAHHHIRLVSGSAVTSLIVTIQGAMAIKTLVAGTSSTSTGSYSTTINISSVFYPLAFFGLLRLFAALWLTDDYLYYGDIENLRNSPSSSAYATASKDPPNVEVRRQATMGLLESEDGLSSDRWHPTNSWRAILFRCVYLIPICCLVAVCLVYLIPQKGEVTLFSITTLLVVLFYATFLVASLILYGFYFLAGRTTNSVIPCATSLWYKIYTAMLLALMLILVILACLETRITPCGLFTTYPNQPIYDVGVCGGYPVGTGSFLSPLPLEFTAIQAYTPIQDGSADFVSLNASSAKNVVVGFQGFCLGAFVGDGAIVDDVVPLNNSLVPLPY